MPTPANLARGRGAVSNATGRYESRVREAFDDGWTAEDAQPQQLTTTVQPEKARVIITRNDSPDIGFDQSINPYRGCEHGCVKYSVTHCRRSQLVRYRVQQSIVQETVDATTLDGSGNAP